MDRSKKRFSARRFSFAPVAEHHGKYFALCVEPRIALLIGLTYDPGIYMLSLGKSKVLSICHAFKQAPEGK
jgi:hypothetical protein